MPATADRDRIEARSWEEVLSPLLEKPLLCWFHSLWEGLVGSSDLRVSPQDTWTTERNATGCEVMD